MKKVNKDFAEEESIEISSSAVLWQTPMLVDQATYEQDFCIAKTSNMQYTLQLKDEHVFRALSHS